MVAIRVSGTGATVAERARTAHDLAGRTRGLMFKKSLGSGEALDIRPCSSIHMMFMRFPIDAVFYDRDFRVTKVASHVRPWVGLAFGGRGAHGVIEMPAGAAGSINPGDVLEFEAGEQGHS